MRYHPAVPILDRVCAAYGHGQAIIPENALSIAEISSTSRTSPPQGKMSAFGLPDGSAKPCKTLSRSSTSTIPLPAGFGAMSPWAGTSADAQVHEQLGSELGLSRSLCWCGGTLRDMLDIRRRVLRHDHPDTPKSMVNLAACLDQAGRFTEAERWVREGLEERTRVLGENDEDTLNTMCELANILIHQGSKGATIKPRRRFRRAQEIAAAKGLGMREPVVLRMMHLLASSLSHQGHSSRPRRGFRKPF